MAIQRSSEIVREAAELVMQMRSVHLATVGSDGAPLASYAPFVQIDGALFVYLSRLAQHTRNLRATALLSAMLIRDEVHCEEIFARPRLVLECTVTEHARNDAVFAAVMDRFEVHFGATARTVRELTDFSLFGLRPHAARLVSGFARAVQLGDDELVAIFGAALGVPASDGTE